ncbi:MAG TPA: alpha/beta fold hydrolase [Candidatus Polarisedimenticolaceae bacterium]|nr:alpha/beta fold hydrolase [Candidatus Polarisedimenticolaceae bacterium]
MRLVVPVLLASIASLAPAAEPSTAAPPAPAADSFELTIGGERFATEELRRVAGPEGTTLESKLTMTGPVGPGGVLSQQARLAPDGHLVSYVLDVDVPGQQVVLKASEAKDAYTMSVTPKGAAAAAQSKDVPAKAPAILLDNTFASHLDGLTRGLLDLAADQERAFTAVVPQIMQAIPATVRRGPDATGTLAGAPVATRTYRIVLANISMDLVSRGTDGALLQAAVPIQRLILKRAGYQAAAPPPSAKGEAPALDPRERATEVAGKAGALPAILLVPKSDAPLPAVLFLSGSGPNDRDETIGPNKPFADIARGLGDRGIASLRFDKRTFAIRDREKLRDVRLRDEYYDDASAALALLRATPGIDTKRIVVVGHSLGAMVAPNVAGEGSGVLGIVMMAPIVRPMDAAIVDQMEFGAKLTGRSPEEIAEQTKDLKAAFAKVKDPANPSPPAIMGASAAYWREMLALDVPKLVRESKLPILVLQGDKDYQVRKDADFNLLQSSVGEAGGRVRYRSFAGLNHLFMKVERESTGAEYGMPGRVEPTVIAAIADWVLTR